MKHLLSIILLGVDFGERVKTMGVQRSIILTELYTVPETLEKKKKNNNPPVTSFSYQTQSHQQSLLLLLVIYVWLIPAPSKLRKSTNCKNHCRALS